MEVDTDTHEGLNMPLSGEAIRLMNYIDDVSVTLRRILTGVATLDDSERALVSAHLAQAKPSAQNVLDALAAKSALPTSL
jgi:hypothetical protein